MDCAFPRTNRFYTFPKAACSSTHHRFSTISVMDLADGGARASEPCLFHKVVPGFTDGFRCDEQGNLWASAADGVHCIAPSGDLLGKIRVPSTVSNLTFWRAKSKSTLHLRLAYAVCNLYQPARGSVAMSVGHVNRIVRISRNVSDLGRSVTFYQERVGFQPSGPAFRMEEGLADLLASNNRSSICSACDLARKNWNSPK